MTRIDQLIGSYYSPEVDDLKRRAYKSFKASVITGIGATILFGSVGFTLVGSIAFQLNVFSNLFIIAFLITATFSFIVLIPLSWFYSWRYLRLCKKTKETIDTQMRMQY